MCKIVIVDFFVEDVFVVVTRVVCSTVTVSDVDDSVDSSVSLDVVVVAMSN